MFTRKGKSTAFDSLNLVELDVRQAPVAGVPHLKAKLCYTSSESGATYGSINIEHNPMLGLEVLSEKTLKAWKVFCDSLEEDQGSLVFGEGKVWDPQMDMFGKNSDSQAESSEGLKVGLGGGV